jgi:beta-N-acetylhexosaminidase
VRRFVTACVLLATIGCATLMPRRGVAALTPDEKIGQLFVFVATGRFMNEASPEYRRLLHHVRDNHIGGIHWGTWSYVHETAFLSRQLQKAASVPLLFSADLESGIGMRFADTTYWPWAMAVAATGDPSLARRQGEVVAEESRAVGLNNIYAPVADVNVNPANPVINVRSYGEDAEAVSRFVSAFVEGVQSRKVMATVKHFPGHGDTQTDSHRSLPILDISRDRLEQVELVPFRAAIAAGVGSVMTAHVSLPALDATPAPPRPEKERRNVYVRETTEIAREATTPASLSVKMTSDLLRGELGFQGVIVTDALDMGGITDHFDPAEASVQAILAGADQVLKSPDLDAAIAGVRSAVSSGRIPRERIDRSVERILAAKKRFGAPRGSVEKAFRVVDSAEHRALAQEIAVRAVTLVREEPGALPVSKSRRVALLAVQGVVESPIRDLVRELDARLENPVESFSLDERSQEKDIAEALEGAARCDLVLVALFVRFGSGEGKIVVPEPARLAIERMLAAGKPVLAVAFGSPFLVQELPDLRTYVVAYGGQEVMQVAVARALFGETPITGRLPVTIPGVAERGSGIQKPAGQAAPSERP